MKQPQTVDEWKSVALARAVDANRLQRSERIQAAVYMLGYALECGLKALIVNTGRYRREGAKGTT